MRVYICIYMDVCICEKRKRKERKKRGKKALTYLDSILYKAWLKGEKPDRKGVGGDDNDDVVCSKRNVFLEQREGPL